MTDHLTSGAPAHARTGPLPTAHRRRPTLFAMTVLGAVVALAASSCVLNGAWTVTAPVDPAPPGDVVALIDVSCPADDFCMALGTRATGPGTTAPVVETWDGTAWAIATFSPTLGSGEGIRVRGVSCGTPTACAIDWGQLVDDEDLGRFSIWDGSTWTTAPTTAVESHGSSVDCLADGSCVYAADFSPTVVWDGAGFDVFSVDDGVVSPDLASLSCDTVDDCIGLRSDGRSVRWNGTTWSAGIALPGVSDGSSTEYASMGCTATDRCVAVGDVTGGGPGASSVPLAARWDGSSWTATPVPLGEGALGSVSCSSIVACVAIGTSTAGTPGVSHPVALAWNGGAWYRAQDPPAPSGAAYAAISCAVGDRCMAVGNLAGGPLASAYAWQPLTS